MDGTVLHSMVAAILPVYNQLGNQSEISFISIGYYKEHKQKDKLAIKCHFPCV